MYFWTPHWAQAKYQMTMMKLPKVTTQCTNDAANNPDAYACGYPQDDLYKAFSDQLATKAPAAFALLSAMQWTNDAQNGVAADIHEGMDPAGRRQEVGRREPDGVAAVGRRRHGGAEREPGGERHAVGVGGAFQLTVARGRAEGPPPRACVARSLFGPPEPDVVGRATLALREQRREASSASWLTCPPAPRQ